MKKEREVKIGNYIFKNSKEGNTIFHWIGNKQEKTADEIFEELGYEKHQKENIGYAKRDENGIMSAIIFDFEKKAVVVHYAYTDCIGIEMQDLKAINMKCKELGWCE